MRLASRRFAIVLLALTASMSLGAQSSKPKDVSAAQKQLEALRGEIRQIAKQQKNLEGERSSALRELRASDDQVASTAKDLRGTRGRIERQRVRLQELQVRERDLQSQRGRQQRLLAMLVRSRYLMGEAPALKALLAQSDVSEANRRAAYLRYLRDAQQRQLAVLLAQQQEVQRLQAEILMSEAVLREEQRTQEATLARLDAERRERDRLVKRLDEQYQDRQQRLKALGRDEKALQSLLAELRRAAARAAARAKSAGKSSSGKSVTGRPNIKLPAFSPRPQSGLPLAGTLLANYGGALPDGHRSNGWLIAAPQGSSVKAVAAGQVVYADWLKGYGLLLIIDHGGGWMSLYAFNDALLKDVGDSVREGEAVSTVGSSGGQSVPALYFELRRNGAPQDPARAAAL